jgi:O-antigen/teichoic acid export membrane protein
VAAGLTVSGLGTVAMIALAARAMPAQQYAAFAVWWTVATLVGTSFGVFEVYLARLVVTDAVAGRSTRAVTGLMAGRAGVVVLGLIVVQLALSEWLASALFDGHLGAALLLPAFTALAAAQALQRGSATGYRKFIATAGQLGTDGVFRICLVGAIIALGAETVTTLALACCTAAAASLLVGTVLCREWLAPPRLRGPEVPVRPMGYLLLGSLGPILANNGSVPWLASTDSVSAYTLGAFAGAVTLSRIPTQFIAAAFSPLLAHLAKSVEEGDEKTFRRLRRNADVLASGLGGAYVLCFAAIGPWLLSLYLGGEYRLVVWVLAVLAAASSLMFIAVVQQAGLVALDRWAHIGFSWLVGTAAFVFVLTLPVDTLVRATIAPLIAVAVALGTMTSVRPRFSSPADHSA